MEERERERQNSSGFNGTPPVYTATSVRDDARSYSLLPGHKYNPILFSSDNSCWFECPVSKPLYLSITMNMIWRRKSGKLIASRERKTYWLRVIRSRAKLTVETAGRAVKQSCRHAIGFANPNIVSTRSELSLDGVRIGICSFFSIACLTVDKCEMFFPRKETWKIPIIIA